MAEAERAESKKAMAYDLEIIFSKMESLTPEVKAAIKETIDQYIATVTQK